jgi:L-lactate dehydrogenase complex protein LldG
MSDGSKQIILQKIKKALATPTPMPFPDVENTKDLFSNIDNDLAVAFAEQFVHLQGKFSWCLDSNECKLQVLRLIQSRGWKKLYCADSTLRSLLNLEWTDDLAGCDAAITGCEALVARTGTIVLSAAQAKGRTASVYAPIHVCIAYAHQLVPDVGDALSAISTKYNGQLPSLISFASGPSRTADIEKTLVTGVHGPKEVFCFLADG